MTLTPREATIVQLIAQGKTNREIGRELRVTENAIKNYLRGIFDKTGMGTRLEVALWHVAHQP